VQSADSPWRITNYGRAFASIHEPVAELLYLGGVIFSGELVSILHRILACRHHHRRSQVEPHVRLNVILRTPLPAVT